MSDNELKQQVLGFILCHQGQAQAIKGSVLASLLGLKDDRHIRLIFRELISEGYPIASSVQKPYGYFLVKDREEATTYQLTLKNRLVEDALRLRDFKRGAGCELALAKQGVLL